MILVSILLVVIWLIGLFVDFDVVYQGFSLRLSCVFCAVVISICAVRIFACYY